MKKKLFYVALAITALASCSSNDFVGDDSPQTSSGTNGAICFMMNTAAITRAGGSDAATALSNQFIVWGEKNETDGNKATAAGESGRSGDLVFPNYQVNWVALPQSTTSNSSGWEYVGYTHSSEYQSYIEPDKTVAQTIKYWDMAANNYVFTAVSALPSDITSGKVNISKIKSDASSVYNKGYNIIVSADASFDKLFFADRNIITSDYGKSPVTLNFRNLLSHIRVGIYETIPGYDVTAIKFYQTDGTTEFKTTGESPTSVFGATVDNLKPGANTLTVTYNTDNKAIVSTSGTRAATITLGQNFNTLSTSSTMAESSATPTWETAGGDYTSVFPREGVTTDMTLKVKYTLYNSASGETIDITGSATVPGEYLQWKPNYKYSYIFKLTDDALTPITFDAVQVETETGSIEYITTVNSPSITTYQNGTEVTTKNEYITGKPIYVVVADGTALTVGTDAKLYTATVDEGFIEGITERTVANAIANGADVSGSKVLTGVGDKKLTVTPAAVTLTAFSTIPAADSPTGAVLTINGAQFTPSAVGNYVFEYSKAAVAAVYTAVANGTTLTSGNKYYTSDAGAGEFTSVGTEVSDGNNYYELTTPASPAVKAYKVIKVVAP